MQRSSGSRLHVFALGILLLGGLLYGLPLSRIPQFSEQEAFFAYPALKAALGGTFTYAVSRSTPFGEQIWAYHGPVLPYLNELLIRIFGFSTLLVRLPDFLGGWLAALLVVLFLNKKQYRYAGVVFALLWCGTSSTQLLNLGRMEGLTLLALVISFLSLDRAIATSKSSHFLFSGIAAGLAILINPLCILFAIAELSLAWLLDARKGTLLILVGLFASLPALLLMWKFRIRESWQQFHWHTQHLKNHDKKQALLTLIHRLSSADLAWMTGLALFTVLAAVLALAVLWKRREQLQASDKTIILAAGLALTGLAALFEGPMFPYYLIDFSLWPMLCAAMLTEKHWPRFRYFAFILGALWFFSAVGTARTVLRSVRYAHTFNKQFLYKTLQNNIPPDAVVMTTPSLYAIPLGAGYTRFGLTRWYKEHEDACPACYLLISQDEFDAANRVAKSNLDQRKVLYAGPSFPDDKQHPYLVQILSPEILPSGAYRTDGPSPH